MAENNLALLLHCSCSWLPPPAPLVPTCQPATRRAGDHQTPDAAHTRDIPHRSTLSAMFKSSKKKQQQATFLGTVRTINLLPGPMHQFTRWLPVGVRGHLAVHHPSHTLCLTRHDPRYIQFTFTERWGDIQGSSIAHMIWGKLPPSTAWTETP